MRCPVCFSENPASSRFCAFCGCRLPAGGNPFQAKAPGPTPSNTPPQTYEAQENPEDDVGRDVNAATVSAAQPIGSALKWGCDLIGSFKGATQNSEDLAHGQVVIISARWILVVAGLVLALWSPEALGELRIAVVLILGLALANFFLHAQVLMRGPVLSKVAYAASTADIAVISLIIIVAGGFGSTAYVFYFPALLALSVAFPSRVTLVFTGATVGVYGVIYLATAGSGEAAVVLTQMLILAGVAFCGNVYWRIEGDRRREAVRARELPRDQVKEGVAVS